MSRKKSFVEKLTPEEKRELEEGKKTGKSSSFRTRCHAILLSDKGYDIGQITDILEVHRSSVYTWFSAWKNKGIEGLKTKSGQGRKAVLRVDNKDHVKAVEKTVKKVAKKGFRSITKLFFCHKKEAIIAFFSPPLFLICFSVDRP